MSEGDPTPPPPLRPNRTPVRGPRIRIRADGPYVVHGPIELVDPDGHELVIKEGENVTLCRCGHSATKPYCDESHRRMGFRSRPAFRSEPEQTAPS